MSDNTSAAMGYAADELRRQGVPEANIRAAAAHLIGQADAESGINPDTSHDRGTGYGIYGAGHERRDQMLGWLKSNGYAPNSLEGQTRYMAREAMSGAYPQTRSILMNASPDSLARDSWAVTGDFERPRVINDRTKAVLKAYGMNVDGPSPVNSGAIGAAAGQSVASSLLPFPPSAATPALLGLQAAPGEAKANDSRTAFANNLLALAQHFVGPKPDSGMPAQPIVMQQAPLLQPVKVNNGTPLNG